MYDQFVIVAFATTKKESAYSVLTGTLLIAGKICNAVIFSLIFIFIKIQNFSHV